jgi:hypothetical protein
MGLTRLVRSSEGDHEVVGLGGGHGRELDVQRLEVSTGDLLVEVLGEDAVGRVCDEYRRVDKSGR